MREWWVEDVLCERVVGRRRRQLQTLMLYLERAWTWRTAGRGDLGGGAATRQDASRRPRHALADGWWSKGGAKKGRSGAERSCDGGGDAETSVWDANNTRETSRARRSVATRAVMDGREGCSVDGRR